MSEKYPDDWESRRRAVLHRDGYNCVRCGTDADHDVLHVDHIEPISDGGGHEIDNLQTLCPDCHAEKHGEERCHICHKIGHHRVDESKTSGSVGLTRVCREHYRKLSDRAENKPRTRDEGSFGDPSAGVCIFCGSEANGKYAIHDHGTNPKHANINSVMCSDCRRLYVFEDGLATRECLQERMVRFVGGAEASQ
jgi:hypothetical protein